MDVFSLIFFIIIAAYLWYTFSIIYHFIRFGIGRESKIMALIFFVGSFLLLVFALSCYSRIDLNNILQKIW